jgi:peptidoglycan/xylan/chitin deacetylase (PgdA/CDA1 family)
MFGKRITERRIRTVVDSKNAIMSIDLEDWFQVENLKSVISRESWGEREYRVEANTERLLEIFADTGTRATFFCLGWVAERSPALIGRIRATATGTSWSMTRPRRRSART